MKNFRKPSFLMILILSIATVVSSQTKQPVLYGKDKVDMFKSHSTMKKDSPYKDLHWQYIGPVNISGRCTDVEAVIPRGDSYTIWVGSASGGVWKSENEGTSFIPVFDNMPAASIGDIAIEPGNEDVYCW